MDKNPSPPPRRFSRFALHLHRWLGLLLGIQIALWILSGVIMSWFHIELVRGESYATIQEPRELVAQGFIAPGGIIARSPGATNVQISYFMGRTVYLTSGNGADNMFDALTGEKITPLKEKTARAIAESDYAGNASIAHARLLTRTPPEYRGPFPVWQIQYRDKLHTRLYVSPNTGKIISRRNNVWRFYDFFWMLHIMDYQERDNSNNLLLKIFSATALVFVLSGLALLILRLQGGKFLHDLKQLTAKGRKKPGS